MRLRSAIPRRVALLHCAPPLHLPVETVNRHHFGDHRLRQFKAGQDSRHRLVGRIQKPATWATINFLRGKRLRISNTHQSVSARQRYGETIALELEHRRSAIGSLVQNLRAGFVPPEPPNRTSRHSATATWV